MAADTRERMIRAAVRALRRDGVERMSFTNVLRESGAARGAIYHHFPGGKDQLVAEAAAGDGREVRDLLTQLPADSAAGVTRGFLELIRPVVAESAAGGGCAVAAAAMASTMLDPDRSDGARRHDSGSHGAGPRGAGSRGAGLHGVADEAVSSWISELAGRFVAAGLAEPEARGLAASLIAILEGAHVLARATGRIDAFDETARSYLALIEHRYGG
jgi:TetR/AcrR family transcriptional regulator, lmrAB and yxaGH operons repressor